ncbi:hypothetical protein [Rhodococcus sp. 077-4]|uniref:hypothetical protein n=1 Tax=Rhodococcus sp. 077-4 TaxID=2789271 RepID=UPI0039F588AB
MDDHLLAQLGWNDRQVAVYRAACVAVTIVVTVASTGFTLAGVVSVWAGLIAPLVCGVLTWAAWLAPDRTDVFPDRLETRCGRGGVRIIPRESIASFRARGTDDTLRVEAVDIAGVVHELGGAGSSAVVTVGQFSPSKDRVATVQRFETWRRYGYWRHDPRG